MSGRRPLPTALKILRGNPGNRKLNRAEPKPDTRIPVCPRHLKGEARSEWRRTSRELHRLGLLTTIDRAALAAYCQVWARWVKAECEVERIGEVVKAPETGYPIQNPFLSVANAALKQMRAYLVEFGMTPSSRSRLTVAPEAGQDPAETFLFGRERA